MGGLTPKAFVISNDRNEAYTIRRDKLVVRNITVARTVTKSPHANSACGTPERRAEVKPESISKRQMAAKGELRMNVRRMGVGGLAGLMAMVVAGGLAVTVSAPGVRAAEPRAQVRAGAEQLLVGPDETQQEQDKDRKDEK